jgi:hypothetical protein
MILPVSVSMILSCWSESDSVLGDSANLNCTPAVLPRYSHYSYLQNGNALESMTQAPSPTVFACYTLILNIYICITAVIQFLS